MNPRLAAFLLLLPILAPSAPAQSPSAQAQYPRLPAPLPAPNPGTPTTPVTPDQDMVSLQFPGTDVAAVLKLYESLTGKRIITDNTVQGTVTIDITKPVSRDEAVRIIETSLNMNGFALTPAGGNLMKLVGKGANPRPFGINIYSDVTQIPENVSIVSVLFRLQYVDSKDIKQVVDQYVSGAPAYSASVALPGSLLVTESSEVLRNIAKVIAAADVPPAEVVSRFYKLERASAKDVVDKMNKLFEKQANGGAGGINTSPQNAPPPGQPSPNVLNTGAPNAPGTTTIPASESGLSEDTIIVGKIKVDFDERTNRIHVLTRPVNLPFIEDLIAQYDLDSEFGQPVKRPLKYVSASDVLDVVVKAITEPGVKSEAEEGGGANNKTSATNTQQQGNNNNNANGGGGSGSGGLSITEELSTQPVDTTPKAVTVGNTKIIADPRENTIIILGSDEVKRKIFALLDQLDVRAPQVMISAVIGEFSLTNDSNFGVDYLFHYPSSPLAGLLGGASSTSGSSGVTGAVGAASGLVGAISGNHGFGISNFSGSGITSSLASSLGAGNGFTAAIGVANSLDVIVNALESTGRFHITNRPMVCTSNNKKAIIVSGQEIAIPTSTLSNLTASGGLTNNTAAVQSDVEYKQVALQLEVVPLINSDREVSLDCLVKLDSPSGTTQNVGGSNVPTINTRYLRDNISLPDRATVVLGGLITKTIGHNDSHIPLLGRIPGISYLFGNKAKQSDRSELVILLRPVVTTNPMEMAQESATERNRMLVEPDVDATIAKPTPASRETRFRYSEGTEDKQQQ